jgi:hypothetical protein
MISRYPEIAKRFMNEPNPLKKLWCKQCEKGWLTVDDKCPVCQGQLSGMFPAGDPS